MAAATIQDSYGGMARRFPSIDMSPTLALALAQMEILWVLVEETGHICSDHCASWTFELRIPDSDMPS
jgi:hypothetical protein